MIIEPATIFGKTKLVCGLITLTSTPRVIANQNPFRIALIIAPTTAGQVIVYPAGNTSPTNGIQLTTNLLPLIITMQQLAGLPCFEWSAIGGMAGGDAFVIEVLYDSEGVN